MAYSAVYFADLVETTLTEWWLPWGIISAVWRQGWGKPCHASHGILWTSLQSWIQIQALNTIEYHEFSNFYHFEFLKIDWDSVNILGLFFLWTPQWSHFPMLARLWPTPGSVGFRGNYIDIIQYYVANYANYLVNLHDPDQISILVLSFTKPPQQNVLMFRACFESMFRGMVRGIFGRWVSENVSRHISTSVGSPTFLISWSHLWEVLVTTGPQITWWSGNRMEAIFWDLGPPF